MPRAVRFDRYGGPEVLYIADVEIRLRGANVLGIA